MPQDEPIPKRAAGGTGIRKELFLRELILRSEGPFNFEGQGMGYEHVGQESSSSADSATSSCGTLDKVLGLSVLPFSTQQNGDD